MTQDCPFPFPNRSGRRPLGSRMTETFTMPFLHAWLSECVIQCCRADGAASMLRPLPHRSQSHLDHGTASFTPPVPPPHLSSVASAHRHAHVQPVTERRRHARVQLCSRTSVRPCPGSLSLNCRPFVLPSVFSRLSPPATRSPMVPDADGPVTVRRGGPSPRRWVCCCCLSSAARRHGGSATRPMDMPPHEFRSHNGVVHARRSVGRYSCGPDGGVL